MTWREVKRNAPCPICGKPGWCGRSDDGAIRCMRIADPPAGWRKLKTCPDGGTVFRPADEPRGGVSARRSAAKPAKARPARTFPTLDSAIAAAARKIGGEHAGIWTYKRGDGSNALYVARFNLPDGGKQFRPFHHKGAGYVMGDPPGLLPLYRLAELSGQPRVFIVEGERCADAAASIGLPVTTSAHGSKSAAKTDWQPLAGREVVMLPDADDAGQHYAQTVASILHRLQRPVAVRILNLPDLPHGGDIADFIEDRQTDAKDDLAIRTEISDLAAQVPDHVPSAGDDPVDGPRPVIVRLADVKAEPVRWLWPGRIALGKVTLFAGDPGLGKSIITLDMAARVSSGTPWADARTEPNQVGGVVLLSAEDDAADTIRPRLDAARADVSRIIALEAVVQRDPETGAAMRTPFCLATDLPALELAIEQVGDCRLVVIDPITAYLGATDSHKNAELRGLLHPLADLARQHRVAVVAVTHLRKAGGQAMYRTMGSLAFVAAARAVWAVTKDRDDPTRRLVLPVKNNLAPDSGGLAYSLLADADGVPRVAWEADPVNITADDALSDERGDEVRSECEAAADWLRDALAAGPMPAKDVKREAKENSIAERTLKRAKKDIGAEARRLGFGKGATWYWALPGTWDAAELGHTGPTEPIEGQPEDVAPYGGSGPLCGDQAASGDADSRHDSEGGALHLRKHRVSCR